MSVSPAPPLESPTGDRRDAVFVANVRDALAHAHDLVYLQTQPLAALVRAQGIGPGRVAVALQHSLFDAIQAMQPRRDAEDNPLASRRYRILELRYAKGRAPDQVQHQLALSQSTYYRELACAVEAVALWCGEQWGHPDLLERPEHRPARRSAARPITRYARSGNLHIAYQVIGDGPIDLVNVMGWVSHVEYAWEDPHLARFLRHLASFCRLITFDKRGTGMSDRVTDMPTLEERMDDVRAVLDAVGSQRAALWGASEGGPMCALFAATYPERTAGLIMYGSYPRLVATDDYPYGRTREEQKRFLEEVERGWGGPVGMALRAPSMAQDPQFLEWWATYLRMSASPGATLTLMRMNAQIDIRDILPSIRVPTLVLHRTEDRTLPVEHARYMAAHIPGAKYVELAGEDHMWWVGDTDAILDEIEVFLSSVRLGGHPDRVLMTVLLITMLAAQAAQARADDDHSRIDTPYNLTTGVRTELARFRGQEIGATSDGFKVAFDGPARAIWCACAIRDLARSMGLDVTAGLHTGECEVLSGGLGGLALRIAARVRANAAPGEVLVSGTVKDLVAGSGIQFEDRGMHVLDDVPGEWRLLAVV